MLPTRTRSIAWFSFFALVLICSEMWIVQSTYFLQKANLLSFAITVDLMIGIPLLYYLFVIRKKYLPSFTVVPVFVLTVVASNSILPESHQSYLQYFEYVLPLIEITLLFLVITKTPKIFKSYQQIKSQEIYPTDAAKAALEKILGPSLGVKVLMSEFTLLYYAFGGWFREFKTNVEKTTLFSYHRKNNYAATLSVFLFLVVVESVVLHGIVNQWSSLFAWILTGVSIYSLLWLIGDYQTIRLQPIALTSTHLYLRTGIRWQAKIPLSKILKIQTQIETELEQEIELEKKTEPEKETLNLSVLGSPNLVLFLKEAVRVQGLFGIKKERSRIGIYVDEPNLFQSELGKFIQGKTPEE